MEGKKELFYMVELNKTEKNDGLIKIDAGFMCSPTFVDQDVAIRYIEHLVNYVKLGSWSNFVLHEVEMEIINSIQGEDILKAESQDIILPPPVLLKITTSKFLQMLEEMISFTLQSIKNGERSLQNSAMKSLLTLLLDLIKNRATSD